MKNTLFKMALPLVAFAASLAATQPKVEAPAQFNHRVSVHPTHYSYEYLAPDEVYFSFDANKNQSYTKDDVMVSHIVGDFRVGRNLEFSPDTVVRPFVGVSASRNISYLMDPVKMFGVVGFGLEKTVADIFTVGLTTKGLFGGIVGKTYGHDRKWCFGVDMSLPITVKFGRTSHWEMRLEPFAVVLNDGNQYLGHRSGLAYRF